MHIEFKALSLSHQNAPVAIRERMHLSVDACDRLALSLNEILGLEEILVLSTCNRTEVYYTSITDHSAKIIQLLCLEKGIAAPKAYARYFEHFNDSKSAAFHLFEVAMGLHSSVIGDLQISNQVKQAYARSAGLKLAGPFVHRLLHTIFHCNKRVQQETAYRDGAASVSYASADLAKSLVAFHQSPAVLVIGAGEMGSDVARNLKNGNFSRIAIMNRTWEKGDALARELEAETIPFEKLRAVLAEFDIVIAAVHTEKPIITAQDLRPQESLRQKFLIDLSVPRAISESVTDINGVLLYDIDEIQERTEKTVARRLEAAPQVRAIIADEMSGFSKWSDELSISPTINKLKDALEQIRRDEMARYLKDADEAEAKLVEQVTRSMMNKIIKLPVLQLKAACKRGEQETLIDVLNDLFDLERTGEQVRK
ncbi:MAG: glutamyl-tRNA reductase [Bacteroidota bacterium]